MEVIGFPLYAPATPRDDDQAALLLLAAVCRQARRDAKGGSRPAAAFLAELQQHRPAGWMFTPEEEPRPMAPPKRRAA